ncbi:hypothetical protein EYF80_017072 [Liparis tanakae]|uniref:Uncharacterized protein n=1 Tax=Liparis tanakae TaxID=230148 RepID=A0A4Z2I5X3_9TELE|nr:hypothetical protein EYF80_017072 [Liparis tanakae]
MRNRGERKEERGKRKEERGKRREELLPDRGGQQLDPAQAGPVQPAPALQLAEQRQRLAVQVLRGPGGKRCIFVHQRRQPSQLLQVAPPLVGHSDQPVEGVVHAVVELRGRGESGSDGSRSGDFCASPVALLASPASQAPPLCCGSVRRGSAKTFAMSRRCVSMLRGTA